MTEQVQIFYYYDDLTRIVYWSEKENEERPDLFFLGSSLNPNKKMAVAAFTHKMEKPWGHRIEPLP